MWNSRLFGSNVNQWRFHCGNRWGSERFETDMSEQRHCAAPWWPITWLLVLILVCFSLLLFRHFLRMGAKCHNEFNLIRKENMSAIGWVNELSIWSTNGSTGGDPHLNQKAYCSTFEPCPRTIWYRTDSLNNEYKQLNQETQRSDLSRLCAYWFRMSLSITGWKKASLEYFLTSRAKFQSVHPPSYQPDVL
jgi:hypothetical protein